MKRTNSSRITYTSLPDVTPESELQTLAAVYAFILECHAKRKADEGSDDEDVETEVRLHKERRSPCDIDD
jgi:hypothetical protein